MATFVGVHGESHAEVAKLFLGHPYFSIFPGDGVEIMECLPIPELLQKLGVIANAELFNF